MPFACNLHGSTCNNMFSSCRNGPNQRGAKSNSECSPLDFCSSSSSCWSACSWHAHCPQGPESVNVLTCVRDARRVPREHERDSRDQPFSDASEQSTPVHQRNGPVQPEKRDGAARKLGVRAAKRPTKTLLHNQFSAAGVCAVSNYDNPPRDAMAPKKEMSGDNLRYPPKKLVVCEWKRGEPIGSERVIVIPRISAK